MELEIANEWFFGDKRDAVNLAREYGADVANNFARSLDEEDRSQFFFLWSL